MHINALPDLVLRLIFSKLSLSDLLQAGSVCPLWKSYQLDITHKVHSVTLLIGVHTVNRTQNESTYRTALDLIAQSPFTVHHCSEVLNDEGRPLFAPQHESPILGYFPYLSLSTAHIMAEALCNVCTLNISINGIHCYVIDQVICLLKAWKARLVTLKLWCCFSDGNYDISPYNSNPHPIAISMDKLLRSFNSLLALQHLTLDLDHFICMDSKCDHDLSFLTRIREFNIRCRDYYCDLPIYGWLLKNGGHSSNTRLQRIGLVVNYLEEGIHTLTASALASKITYLPQFYYAPRENIRRNLPSLTSLVSLEITFFNGLFNLLVPLKQLVHLKLNFFGERVFDANFSLVPPAQLPQLVSVRLLSLDVRQINHSELDCPHWGWIFPSVQIVHIQHNCFHTNPNYFFRKCFNLNPLDTLDNLSPEKMIVNIFELLRTFKQCPSLRRIYLNDDLPKYQDPFIVAKFKFNL